MSTIKATTLSNQAGNKQIPIERVAQGVAAAWVNFNGTGTVAIRAAFNVSSITDNGTGDYTLNFTTALPDANYAYTFGVESNASPISGNVRSALRHGTVAPTASALRIQTYDNAGGFPDLPTVCVGIFR